MTARPAHLESVRASLKRAPVVALLGARQVGKTWLAREIAKTFSTVSWFDLEDPVDVARLAEPGLALGTARGLVVLDEVQRRPELFPILRVLADRRPVRTRFLVTGSASPELLRQSSETLAGRVAFHELPGFDIAEVGVKASDRLMLRGGFPRSFLARSEADSYAWRTDFIRTYVERDLPALGIGVPSATMARFWTMLAHYHGQILNSSELARAFGVSDMTVRRYLETLVATFAVRVLPPFHENVGKRLVRSPKVYLADSGILHALLGLRTRLELEGHPKIGASFEGFAIAEAMRITGATKNEAFFYRTQAGAELDLVVARGGRRLGFEIKRTDAPRVTPSMRIAREDLRLDALYVVHAGTHTFDLADGIRAVPVNALRSELGGATKPKPRT